MKDNIEPKDEITIDGVLYRRVEEDSADELIKRIQRIVDENGVTRQQAAWSVLVTSYWLHSSGNPPLMP